MTKEMNLTRRKMNPKKNDESVVSKTEEPKRMRKVKLKRMKK